MKNIKSEIIKAAGGIITEAGTGFLTTESLAAKMGVDHKILNSYFKSDADILIFLLLKLKQEIELLINDAGSNNRSAEEELQLLFESMFNFFTRKPYFLIIVLNSEQDKMCDRAQEILISIKTVIGNYLLKIIDRGKKDEIFKAKRTPDILATSILESFRLFMNQQNKLDKIARDLKMIRDNPNFLSEQYS